MAIAAVSDVDGAVIVQLGKVSQVNMGNSGQGIDTVIFRTGDIRFPSPSSRVYVAYVSIAMDDGLVLPSPSVVQVCNLDAGSVDWAQPDLGAAPWNSAANLPIVLDAAMVFSQSARPPVYATGVRFGIRVSAGSVSANGRTATITAYGWAR